MWRTLRNRHLAATTGGVRTHIALMFMSALTGIAFFMADFPLWRILVIISIPALMGGVEVLVTRRVHPDHFDRAFMRMSWFGLAILAVMVAITNGLRGPMAPFLIIAGLIPLFLFGEGRFAFWQQVRVVVVIIVIGFLPEEVLGPPLNQTQHALIMALVAVSSLCVVTMRVRQFTNAAKEGLRELDRMREERLSETEERLQRMQSVSSRIAHELKNPLAAVKSLVQLTMKNVTEADRERLGVAQEEINRMETILRDYLSFSRPLDDLKVGPVDVADVVADVREVLAARAENAGISLEPMMSRAIVHADSRRLKEALINLVGNAIEATPAGGKVTVSCAPTTLGAQIVVRDSGRGMTPDELQRVGTPYFTTRAEGTGLGVHLARGVIAQHGGTITYESEPGRGTTVVIALPPHPPTTLNLECAA